MKDYLKRTVIVLLILIIISFILFYFSKNNEENKIVENNMSENTLAVKEDERQKEEVFAISTSNINFREQPNIDSSIILVIPKNVMLNILEKNTNWYKVVYDKKEGYVNEDYVRIITDEEKKQFLSKEDYENMFAKVCVNGTLNIRDSANKEAKILTNVKANSVLKVISKMQNGWYKVEGNGIIGYVSGEYIKLLSKEEYASYSSKENNLLDVSENIIAKYTSTSTYNKNSRYNMHLASDYINNTIVAPGETYSHLRAVHPEGEENKYVESTIFVSGGKTAQASGGGICQTSSTLYAAIVSSEEKGIRTGLNVTAQAPHSGKVNYVPRKYEATVSSGVQDFCFRNCNSYSIKISTVYDYNTLTITIYKI